MTQTGQRSERMLRRYIRDGELSRDNSAGAGVVILTVEAQWMRS
jgi:hypothetical protein